MSDKKITYREWIPSPRLLRGSGALFVAVLFWWMLVEHVFTVSGQTPAILPSIVFIAGFSAVGYGILSLFHGISIRITRQWLTDGTRQPVLKIRGIIKDDRTDIPCRNIRNVQPAAYKVPLWRGLLGPFGRKKVKKNGSQGHMITLAGYSGTGLAVTYVYESIFSNAPKEITLLFPTRRPKKLQALLIATAA